MKTDDGQPCPTLWPARRARWLAAPRLSTSPHEPLDPDASGTEPAARDRHRQDLLPPPDAPWPRVFPGL